MTGPADASGFAELGLRPELEQALLRLGYEEPTPIQREAIPLLLQGRDLIGQAATGTGKTAAFALPLLQRLAAGARGTAPVGLVLTPTRELAVQVAEAVTSYGRDLGARVLAVYGGQPIGRQLRPLERGVDLVVATPGRALDHIQRGTLRLSGLAVVVLDEADEMFDMGFADDIEAILGATPPERQTVLFSATMPHRVDRMARRHLRDAVRVQVERERLVDGATPLVRQTAYLVARAHKPAALARVLALERPAAALVFCRTRGEVDALTEVLNARGHRAEALHGGMSQEQRDRVMSRLRNGTAELLVATDVAARGLDVDHLSHVVNYDVPSAPESYVHRIGRVGRAGREGVAITLAEPREQRMLQAVERTTGVRIPLQPLPTVADLRGRRLERTRLALLDAMAEGDLDAERELVASLPAEHDPIDVAAAALRLLHRAGAPQQDEQEIPTVAVTRPAPVREPDASSPPSVRQAPTAPSGRRQAPVRGQASGQASGEASGQASGRASGQGRPLRQGAAAPATGSSRFKGPPGGMTRLFVGAGSAAGIRPQDLVGAIAGESRLSGRDIGAIEITERFSLVEVPESAADEVIAALRGSVIKGRKTLIRRERF